MLLIIIAFSISSCSQRRDIPPESELEEYGITTLLVENGICVDQIKFMLDDYGIENNYPDAEPSTIRIYLGLNEDTGQYYEVYAPVLEKYDVLIRETVFPSFNEVENQISEYLSINTDTSIELCDDYCDLFHPADFYKDQEENIDFLHSLDSIFC